MEVTDSINSKITENFDLSHFEIINESHMHAGPATDSHFKLILVSEDFKGLGMLRRHFSIYKLLAEELAGPVHALALHTYTDEEWSRRAAKAPDSPQCRSTS